MVARRYNVKIAEIGLANFREDFPTAIDRLSMLVVANPVDIACSASHKVKRNRVFVYFHPTKPGRLVVRHHPEDFEAVNTLIRDSGNPFVAFETVDSVRGV